jgi:cysteine desulfurase
VGKIAVDVMQLQVDLLSFSAHKMYGPKGVGALYVRRSPQVRLEPQIDGGGQEGGLRSGTLNVPGIVGLAKALELCSGEMGTEISRQRELRDRLYQGLTRVLSGVSLNGPALDDPDLRLSNNLNCTFDGVEGEALMLAMRTIAVSSGSACTSANPEPSHVLRALGLSTDQARSSLRFGLGRFTTAEEIETAIAAVTTTVRKLRELIAPVGVSAPTRSASEGS